MKIKDIPDKLKQFWKFITEDIWRISSSEVSKKRHQGYSVLKVIYISIRRFQEDNLSRTASALTYSTFLSVIPLLAVLVSIAKGFGFQSIVESQLFQYFPGQQEVFEKAIELIGSYMQYTKGGVFFGFGLILLLYTVYNLISNIENAFNNIWQVSKSRSFGRKVTDYFSVIVLMPVFLVCTSGVSIFMSTAFETLNEYEVFTPIYELLITVLPVIFVILFFTLLYKFLPNTTVKFKHAFFAGIVAGIGFMTFQYLYVNGQIWVSKYNAIYGTFAFVPLLLLWMQLSWTICLIGAEIAYAGQNVKNFDFDSDSKNISRRYLDFFTLIITSIIVKRFEKGEPAMTAGEISGESKIPIRLTNNIINLLVDLELLSEIKDGDKYTTYQPAVDINLISLEYLFAKIDQKGSENFKVDKGFAFHPEWNVILQSRKDMFANNKNVLVKDVVFD
ncbi:YihY/virulence factor BrkB family protein [Bacteroidales bacterium OttesenSCG-928-I14]|nr:YihY/virulence factor BrkB family protein [Bacteroidales bacterium OttesenSCG-928-I14]